MTALYAFTIFAGACLVLAVAWLLGLWAFCWSREICRDVAEEWAMRHRQPEDQK